MATLVLQQVVDFLTALIIIAISIPLLGSILARWAGVFHLLLPSGIIFSSTLIPDILIAFLAAASGLLWLRTAAGKSRWKGARNGLIAGIAFSAGIFLKPVLLYAPAIYFALIFLPPRQGRIPRALFASVLTLVSLSTFLLIRVHNVDAFGLPGLTTQDAFEPMGRMVQITDYHGTGVGGDRFCHFRDSLEAVSSIDGRIDYRLRDSVFRAVTREAILSEPLRVAYFELSRWPKFFLNFGGNQSYLGLTPTDRKPLWWVLLTTLPQLLLGLGLFSAILSREVRGRLNGLFWLGLGWFLYSVPVIGPIASFRYGLMFYWALVPFVFVSVGVLRRRHEEISAMAVRSGKSRE